MSDYIKFLDSAAFPVALGGVFFNAHSLIKEKNKYNLLKEDETERYRTNIVTKMVVNIMKIVSGSIQAIASGGKWICEVSKNLSCLVYLRFFSLFSIVIHGVASFIDIFRITDKLHSLEARIKIELNRAEREHNTIKEKEIQAYKIVKYIDMMSAMYSVALCIVTVVEFFGFMVFSPTAIIAIIGFGGLLYLTSFIISKVYNMDEIERKHFGRAGNEI